MRPLRLAEAPKRTDTGEDMSLDDAERSELIALRRQARRHRVERDLLLQEQSLSPTQRAILEATERLLQSATLQKLSVAQIVSAARLSRPTFYLHYRSKNDVVAALLNRAIATIVDVIQPWLDRDLTEPPELTLRAILSDAADIWAQHGAVLRAVQENWSTIPEFEALWLSAMHRFRDDLVGQIEAERTAGTAPQGLPADVIAVGLIWASERALYISTRGVEPTLPNPAAAVEVLMALWIPAIYGYPFDPRQRPEKRRRSP